MITFKEIWPGRDGGWLTDGGFPLQMASIASLFTETTMILVQVPPRQGGIPLPQGVRVVPISRPVGQDLRRKASVVARLPYYLWTIAREVRRADVVHTPLPGDISFLGLLAAQVFRKRLVARYCGSWFPNSQTTVMNRVTRTWMRLTAGGRNVMLATGEDTTPPGDGMHWVFATAVSARELAAMRPDLERRLASPPRLVFIGRLEAGKGLRILLDALHQLRSRGFEPLPHMKFIGHGSERSALERHASERGLSVEFTGLLGRAALSQHLLEADICVQPSLSEGFSKAWLDAMAHGLPVIASDVGAARKVLGADGERGWLLQPGSVDSLASKLAEVLSGDIDWPAIRRRCRAFAEAHTLEVWGARIGAICAEQWGARIQDGRLV